MTTRTLISITTFLLMLPVAGCSGSDTSSGQSTPLSAECVEDATGLEGWLCPDDLTVECEDGGADPDLIYFEPSGDLPESCEEIELTLNDEGPFEVGTHPIVISASASGGEGEPVEVACEAQLTVQDTLAPEPVEEALELWPPNHKLHTISGDDCVRDACDGDLQVTFLSASSDEPVNDRGDGNTEPDIVLECDQVKVRAERQGPSNGRVYTLGYKAVDDSGNETQGECVVVVPHDQSGRDAIDDGPAYELTLDEEECNEGTGGAGGAGGASGAGGAAGAGGSTGPGGSGGAAGAGGAGGIEVP